MTSTHDRKPKAVLIAGPTASGKSAMAICIAQALDGVVINTDSMQVYGDLRIISARPGPEEEATVPHRLFGMVDGAVNFSVGAYVDAVRVVLAEVQEQGRLPVLVGGTGLYFKALTEGLSQIPPVSDAVREVVRARCDGRGTDELYRDLLAVDPVMAARLRPTDRLRIMRALEVQAQTGESLSVFQGQRQPGPLDGLPLTRLFLTPERDLIRARIDSRFTAMMQAGALDEVAALRERRLDPMLPVMRAHGVPGLIAHLDGNLSLDEAIARGQADTRAYAKRQMTWFRHQMAGWTAVDLSDVEILTNRIIEDHTPQPF
jgi:tRNA dimethylallyltransferase